MRFFALSPSMIESASLCSYELISDYASYLNRCSLQLIGGHSAPSTEPIGRQKTAVSLSSFSILIRNDRALPVLHCDCQTATEFLDTLLQRTINSRSFKS